MTNDVDSRLRDKLQVVAEQYDQITQQLGDPEVAGDPHLSIKLAKEMGRLRDYCRMFEQLEEAQSIVADSGQDGELRKLAREEIPELQKDCDRRWEALKESLVTADDVGITSIILEIRAGTGGEEAALFARDLYEMYLRYSQSRGFSVEVLDQSFAEAGGLKEVILNIKGEGVWQALGYEGGGHRVQRVPKTETQGRIHTSAATVAVLPEPDEINIEVNWDTDVDEFVSRAGGPGGQNVNKVSSAIRLHHKATGIAVSMRDEKSQHKNRAKARRIMLARLYDREMQQQTSERDSARRSMIGSGDRSQRIRTYNFPQNRCSDHRINLDLHSLDKIMQGELGDLIDALQTHDKQKRLENLTT